MTPTHPRGGGGGHALFLMLLMIILGLIGIQMLEGLYRVGKVVLLP